MDNLLNFEQLPTHLIFWLDHVSLLKVQTAGILFPEYIQEIAWQHLCAVELGVSPAKFTFNGKVPMHTDSSSASSSGCPGARYFPAWRRIFYDLDVGSVQAVIRQTAEDYAFFSSRHGEIADAPHHFMFEADERGRTTSCGFTGPLGRDRCIVGSSPLPELFSATVLPKETMPESTALDWTWQAAYRSCGYYEITIEDLNTEMHNRLNSTLVRPHCVSVGLCTSKLSRHAILHEQVGWDPESWALHGDDGHLYHGNTRGRSFTWFVPDDIRRQVLWPKLHQWREGMTKVTFGVGDTVGCGLVHLLPYNCDNIEVMPETHHAGGNERCCPEYGLSKPSIVEGTTLSADHKRGIFFTLNGEFIGMPFLVDEVPLHIPLWPCVGIDAPWMVKFNFGQQPFQFDLDQAISAPEVRLSSIFDTLEVWTKLPAFATLPAGQEDSPEDHITSQLHLVDGSEEHITSQSPVYTAEEHVPSQSLVKESSGAQISVNINSRNIPWYSWKRLHAPACSVTPSTVAAPYRGAVEENVQPLQPKNEQVSVSKRQVQETFTPDGVHNGLKGKPCLQRMVMPLTSKITERVLLGRWASLPAFRACRRYCAASPPGRLFRVDRSQLGGVGPVLGPSLQGGVQLWRPTTQEALRTAGRPVFLVRQRPPHASSSEDSFDDFHSQTSEEQEDDDASGSAASGQHVQVTLVHE